MKSIRVGEPFLLICDIRNQSTHPIIFSTSGLIKVSVNINIVLKINNDNNPVFLFFQSKFIDYQDNQELGSFLVGGNIN